MSIRYRLQKIAETVKDAGVSGQSMQAALEKVAYEHDLTAEEIHRVAEMANRDTQLALHKTATDKRFAFKLADPKVAVANVRKVASQVQKVASAPTEDHVEAYANGDPFAAPLRGVENLSILRAEISDERAEKLAAERNDATDRELLMQLDKARLDYEALDQEATAAQVKVAAEAVEHHKQMVQSAADLVEQSVTLPSLYDAIYACDPAAEDQEKNTDALIRMVIDDLKSRGVSHYKMGFRSHGDPEALEKLSADQLVQICKDLSAYTKEYGTLSMCDTKTAEYMEQKVPSIAGYYHSAHLPDSHADGVLALHNDRSSVKDHAVPGVYVRDAENMTGNKLRVLNTDSSFALGVKNLIGDQRRMVQHHSAKEYIGLKLKQIEEAMRSLTKVREARAS